MNHIRTFWVNKYNKIMIVIRSKIENNEVESIMVKPVTNK